MIEQKLQELQVQTPSCTNFVQGYLSSGFVLPDTSFACIPTAELTQRRKMRRQKWRTNYHNTVSDYLQLVPGDIVVHFHHGIGKFLGIEKLPNNQQIETEYLHLEYADQGKIYVPVMQSHLVTRYVGAKDPYNPVFVILQILWKCKCLKRNFPS